MTTFTKKKITQTNRVCLRLKAAREAAGVSVETMAEKTRLAKKYILALERCDFDALPKGEVYQKNFIKRYVQVLNLPATSFIQQFVLEEGYGKPVAPPHVHPHTPKSLFAFRGLPDIFTYVSVAVVLFGVFGYLGWQVHHIIKPPTLVVASPENGHVTSEEQIVIQGVSEPETHITINGKEIPLAEEGYFEQPLDLVEGVNTIVVSATKKHGKTTTETRYVTQRPVQQVAVDTSHDTNS